MLIQERIQVILKMHNLSPSAFADKIGVQRSNISHVLTGRSKPGLDFLEKILINFPRVNAHWLITGQMVEGTTEKPNDNLEINHSNSRVDSSQLCQPEKIIVLYSDGTFKEFKPSAQ